VAFTIFVAATGAGAVVALGLLGGFWLLRNSLRAIVAQKQELQLARKELRCVRDLALRVAKDVDGHGLRVQQINDKLTMRKAGDLDAVVTAVDHLVKANKQLLVRMADAEARMCEHSKALELYVLETRTDALTGLPNRRALDAELTSLFDDFRRHAAPVSIVLLDLDRFKRINDEFGYEFGDEMLRGIAGALQRSLHGMQTVSRIGGEEFLVTLPGKVLDEACRIAKELRRSVAQARFRFQEKEVLMTTSAGVAQLMPGEPTLGLLDRANQALLSAKANWPDAICWHDGRAIHDLRSSEQSRVRDVATAPESGSLPESSREDCPAAAPLPASSAAAPHADDHHVDARDRAPPLPPIECDRSRVFLSVRQRIAETKRGGPGFSLILLRMDNDARRAGIPDEPASEESIQAIRRMLAANLREMDIVGHYAHGCFVLLLPQACLDDAVTVADRLVQSAGQLAVPTRSGPQPLAVSAGIAEVRESDDAVGLFQRAEAALAFAEKATICANDGASIKVFTPLITPAIERENEPGRRQAIHAEEMPTAPFQPPREPPEREQAREEGADHA
jgi:diguanylate cyclase